MDRILDSGSNDKGSIPFGSTKKGYDFQKFVTRKIAANFELG